MAIEKEIIKQIKYISSALIGTNLSISYNDVASKAGVIYWADYKNISFALRNVSYEEIYYECVKERAFNFMLIDGALIQLMYKYSNEEVTQHRLAFYPNPNISRYQEFPDDYEELFFGCEPFAEMIEGKIIAFPLRFDFDSDEKKFVEYSHSYSHLTLGNFENCRIPVSKPISPNKFISFILRSFYFEKFFENFAIADFSCPIQFQNTLTKDEHLVIHINH